MNNVLLKKYNISLLPNNEIFKYNIDSKFFNYFLKEKEDYSDPKINIIIKKKSKEGYIMLKFHFYGYVTLVCDITLKSFIFKINKKKKLNIFFSKNITEDSGENIVLPINTVIFNISQYIYDSITLMLPIKKIYPKIKKIYKKI